jgi:DNA polymerase IV
VDNHWDKLTRVQQVGIKYYDEFKEPMSRREVSSIAATILSHAEALRPGMQMVIVGGYRRGNATCQDLDVVLSHPDPGSTFFFVKELVARLEEHGLITHVLSLSTHNSKRWQRALDLGMLEGISWGGGGKGVGGFDSLDKALVVWQDLDPDTDTDTDTDTNLSPSSLTPSQSRRDKNNDNNNNLHRRVDIIVTPWETAGCAVLGWTGGTTFERDLRRLCKTKGLKFDSGGLRDRGSGKWVDVEDSNGSVGDPAPDMETAERRVFDALGLEYRRPEERCTG